MIFHMQNPDAKRVDHAKKTFEFHKNTVTRIADDI
jgi:hypothetical protein